MDCEIITIAHDTGGDISLNPDLMKELIPGNIGKHLIDAALKGTPLLKFGSGSPRILLCAGIHGNELPPQVAFFKLLNYLEDKKINGTVYTIPIAIPYATMKNSRRFQGWDMNRKTFTEGYVSNNILKTAQKLEIQAAADFHSTQPQSNPGIESVFCSKKPCYKSFKIADHITSQTSSKVISQEKAGTLYGGALEDELNLSGIPAVTCEVVSRNGKVDSGSVERSLMQMKSFLNYFNVI
ncbi:succinylglutamate desuccinylase/aspartoacylase family protein [Methanobacterium formicicum]|uniref:Succinylglutamate desuccinylase n=1 Tax=Methanobacterium formicicum (strain DSM 3637 / PP1) TaxID=1204725 RepID=K2R600_METFP|nr:succinylglutamate desuccinylase/aspartoacylase family protein [Methanobacterium formicicum]EKF86682.1 succinylglutamate desuccinylase [Methanobacterium formicicum DSM 3637]